MNLTTINTSATRSLVLVAAALLCEPIVLGQTTSKVRSIDLEPHDKARDRTVPLRVYLPADPGPSPVVLFSHGLGGSREGGAYLGNHWASEGYVAVFMQHAGSDRDVMKGVPLLQKMAALKKAASLQSARDRLADVSFVIDELERWSPDTQHPLGGKLNLEKIGMSGHSFGAVTTLGVAGKKSFLMGNATEERIDAFLAMSPQPGKGMSPEKSLAPIDRPMLCMTGTKDDSPLDPAVTPQTRQLVFKALPKGDKYHLVLHEAHHFAFSDETGFRRRERDPQHHPAINTISVKFWDAYLSDDQQAKQWLQSDAVKTEGTIKPVDVWQWK